MGISAGSLNVDLTLQAQQFINGIKESIKETREFHEEILESKERLAEFQEGLLAAFAVDYIKEKVESALEYAESIKKVSEATGASSKFVQLFSFAAGQAGQSTEVANDALTRFTKSLGQAANGNQQTLKVFKDLGVTSTDTATAVKQFADHLEEVPSHAQKVADVTAVFGRSAAGLLPVLEELAGSGFSKLSKEAEELGVVLSDQVINQSVEAEHKITALKAVMNAEFANVIGQNATALTSMATALISVAGAAAKAASNVNTFMAEFAVDHPGLTKFTTGLLGQDYKAIQSRNLTEMLGTETGRSDARRVNTAALNTLNNFDGQNRPGEYLGNTGDDGRGFIQAGLSKIENTPAGRAAAHTALLAMMDRIKAAGGSIEGEAPEKSPVLPGLKPPKAKPDHTFDQAAAFEKALASERLQTDSLKGQLTADPGMQANYHRDAINYDYGSRDDATGAWVGGAKDREVDDALKAGKLGPKGSDLAKSRADQLKKQNDINGELQYELVNRQLDNKLNEQDLALRQQDFEAAKAHLSAQLDLARTAEERKKIADQLIDLETKQKQDALSTQLKQQTRDHDDAGAALTQKKLDALPQESRDQHAANAQQNAGPLQSYLAGINTSAAGLKENLEGVEADGLKSLSDGLVGVVSGTKSLKAAFSDLAKSIISDLAKIAIEDAIIKPLAGALFGGATEGSSGGSGGLLSGLFGHRANGGDTPAGNYLVGERGPELVSIGAHANVTTNAALQGLASGRAMSNNITVSGVNDPAMVRKIVGEMLGQLVPAQLRMGADYTNTRNAQKRLR